MSVSFPIAWADKQNNPELLAALEAYGEENYLKAEEINLIRDAINYLYDNSSVGSLTVWRNLSSQFPTIGAVNVLYIAKQEDKMYQWNSIDEIYEELSPGSIEVDTSMIYNSSNPVKASAIIDYYIKSKLFELLQVTILSGDKTGDETPQGIIDKIETEFGWLFPPSQGTIATEAVVDSKVSAAVVSLFHYQGDYNPNTNLFPESTDTELGDSVKKGYVWTIIGSGQLGTKTVSTGDLLISKVNTPGQTSSNWTVQENNLGYVAENANYKVTSISGTETDANLYANLVAALSYFQQKLVSGTNLKTLNSFSLLGSGNLVIKSNIRHIFSFDKTFPASTSWYGLARESSSLYDLTSFVTTTYNGTTILEPRCIKFPIPSNCKLAKAQIIFSTLATPVDLRVLYFENTSGNTDVLNQTTIASVSIPASSNNTVTDFSTQDLSTQLNAGGYVTFALFNNNVSTGVMRNVMLILDFNQL